MEGEHCMFVYLPHPYQPQECFQMLGKSDT